MIFRKAYAEYFAWRKGSWTVAPWNAPGYRNGFCRLCERLWEENPQNKVVRLCKSIRLFENVSAALQKISLCPSQVVIFEYIAQNNMYWRHLRYEHAMMSRFAAFQPVAQG